MMIHVLGTPDNLLPGMTADAAAVVIDVLRMTSTAAAALKNGCAGVYACESVAEAREKAAACGALLGGERNALLIEGFDFSNSPLEYTKDRVQGKRVVMSTSNGTRAIAACAGTRRTLLGALVNARETAKRVMSEEKLLLVCAGTMGKFTLEDALAAGAIIAHLQDWGVRPALDDMARASLTLYAHAREDLKTALNGTKHFEHLRTLGFERDLDFCLNEDAVSIVGERGEDGWFTCRNCG